MLDKGIFYRKFEPKAQGHRRKMSFWLKLVITISLWGESPHAYLSSDCFPDPTLPV